MEEVRNRFFPVIKIMKKNIYAQLFVYIHFNFKFDDFNNCVVIEKN